MISFNSYYTLKSKNFPYFTQRILASLVCSIQLTKEGKGTGSNSQKSSNNTLQKYQSDKVNKASRCGLLSVVICRASSSTEVPERPYRQKKPRISCSYGAFAF